MNESAGQLTVIQGGQLPTPYDYRMAIAVQTGCNLSGIVASLHQVMPRIWNEARRNGHGTDYVNTHPISRLYAEQIAYLSGCGATDYGKSWGEAMKTCEERQKEIS